MSEGYDNLVGSDTQFGCENGRKGKRVWKKGKYQLVEYHSLPMFQRDNEFILRYYRSGWPLKQVLLSVFSIHNETLNIWTHLMGFFLFLCLTLYTVTKAPNLMSLNSLKSFPELIRRAELQRIPAELLDCLRKLPSMSDLLTNCSPKQFSSARHGNTIMNGLNDIANMVAPLMVRSIPRWPFFAFLGGAMFCLLASSTCHLLGCHSERLSYIMLKIDYLGIAVLITTSFYPSVYYSFMCNPFFRNFYLAYITIIGITIITLTLLPFFHKPEFRSFRASLFFGMGISAAAPVLHKLVLYGNQKEAVLTTGYEVLMGVLYGLGALIYALRIPERWRPGKFDIAGHSHQLFHVLVVAGAYTHYRTGLVYLKWRDLQGC
ncbi:hypothetical protein UlMin_035401 [Ulmus minor]